jgi:hypothetical protein
VPLWDGSSFEGRRLLVHYEQGFGDNIQFCRYLPMVKGRGGTVIFECKRPLVGLFRGFEGVDELIEGAFSVRPSVSCVFHISLLDLPGIFGTVLEHIPAKVPYIRADCEKAAYWRGRLGVEDFKVGIVWAGRPTHENDRERSCGPEHFAVLSEVGVVRLYGLQKDEASARLNELSGRMRLTNLGGELNDFTDTAAVIEELDLVISVDTAVLHLAGAMGKCVWGLLPFVPDWRWMSERADSPWYPTMRLFRQKRPGQWGEVFERVAGELREMVKGQPG